MKFTKTQIAVAVVGGLTFVVVLMVLQWTFGQVVCTAFGNC